MKAALVTLTSLLLAACAGEVPSAEIVSATPEALMTMDDANDDLTLVVHYSDPNGDLGTGKARVHDCRSEGVTTEFALPELANWNGVELEIEMTGEIKLVLTDVGVVPEGTLPEPCEFAGVGAGAFCVVLVDAAGNESDPACTEVLAIK
ncbi:MAG: hypothetical protein HOV80_12955 [Polyangiaceae bacterium]|nr:hypothetical protein [Polyangiaceae bacterium]